MIFRMFTMCSKINNDFDNDAHDVPLFRIIVTCLLRGTVLQISTKSMIVIRCFFMNVQLISDATAFYIFDAFHENIFF